MVTVFFSGSQNLSLLGFAIIMKEAQKLQIKIIVHLLSSHLAQQLSEGLMLVHSCGNNSLIHTGSPDLTEQEVELEGFSERCSVTCGDHLFSVAVTHLLPSCFSFSTLLSSVHRAPDVAK